LKRKNLIKLRIDLGLKSKEMAEKLNITTTKYSNIENGKVEPSIGLLFKIQETFGIDNVLDLFEAK
jgi:DNA-binding XRE family transcriptional regulator